MLAFSKIFLFFTILLIQHVKNSDQSPLRVRQLEKRYDGIWIDKKTSRCLQISIESERYVTITDWTKKYQKRKVAMFIKHL